MKVGYYELIPCCENPDILDRFLPVEVKFSENTREGRFLLHCRSCGEEELLHIVDDNLWDYYNSFVLGINQNWNTRQYLKRLDRMELAVKEAEFHARSVSFDAHLEKISRGAIELQLTSMDIVEVVDLNLDLAKIIHARKKFNSSGGSLMRLDAKFHQYIDLLTWNAFRDYVIQEVSSRGYDIDAKRYWDYTQFSKELHKFFVDEIKKKNINIINDKKGEIKMENTGDVDMSVERKLTEYPHKYTYVEVHDHPGAGGACHKYTVFPKDIEGVTGEYGPLGAFNFQNGPIKEAGINGVMNENLIAIVIDRLQHFQKGEYATRENAIALQKLEEAMLWLNKRTADREARGVEGTYIK